MRWVDESRANPLFVLFRSFRSSRGCGGMMQCASFAHVGHLLAKAADVCGNSGTR